MNRDLDLKSLRPTIDRIDLSKEMNANATFQNITIRPILKFQSEVLCAIFNGHIYKRAVDLGKMAVDDRNLYVRNVIQKDLSLRNILIGVTLGMMSLDEIRIYYENEAESRSRIIKMIIERIIDQM